MVFYAKAIALTSLLINIAQYGPEFHTTAFQYSREWRVGEIYSDPICDRCLWAALSLPAQANHLRPPSAASVCVATEGRGLFGIRAGPTATRSSSIFFELATSHIHIHSRARVDLMYLLFIFDLSLCKGYLIPLSIIESSIDA